MLAESAASLVASVGLLTDEQARGPSLLPGWTRGHLLTHVARNAEGGTRLLGWARTGVPSYEYRSVAARAAAIEEGAGRPAAVLAGDVRAPGPPDRRGQRAASLRAARPRSRAGLVSACGLGQISDSSGPLNQ
jgi:uncharacterized protein (TIGR03083 family)